MVRTTQEEARLVEVVRLEQEAVVVQDVEAQRVRWEAEVEREAVVAREVDA